MKNDWHNYDMNYRRWNLENYSYNYFVFAFFSEETFFSANEFLELNWKVIESSANDTGVWKL